jgi:hypothetical protein
VGQHTEPHGLVGEVELDTHGAGELPVPVGQQQHLVPDAEALLLRAHHEGVVDGDAGHGVNPLGAELPGLGHEAREVLLGAGGRERARHREQHQLLPRGQLADRHGLQLAVGGVEVGELRVREAIPDRDGCGGGGRRGSGGGGPPWSCAEEPGPEGARGRETAGGGGGGQAQEEEALTDGHHGGGGGGSHGGGDVFEEEATFAAEWRSPRLEPAGSAVGAG